MVAVMQDGRLVQWGPPAQLINEQGLFATLSRIQEAPAAG
jgi:ABC-type multidrug transport system fused ATPase/permease subunit